MSFSIDHDWASVDTSDLESLSCPKCQGILSSFLDRDENPIYGVTYYAPRHIPPYVWLTCTNEDCELFEESIRVNLTVKINVELVKP